MRAERGISEHLKIACARVHFGKCLCGQAALTKKVQFFDHLSKEHVITYAGTTPHGHYCVPIMFSDRVLGVLNLYVRLGHPYSRSEENFLTAVADALAGVILHKKAEDDLNKAYIRLRDTQEQLIQAEKLKAVGILASGVAHEIKNPLATIMQCAAYLERKLPAEDERTKETLNALNESVERAQRIVSSLLDYSRATALNLKPEDAGAIIDETLNLVKNQHEFRHIEVTKEFKESLPRVLVDKYKTEQVFVNILLNAAQAMPEGGRIVVRGYDKIMEPGQAGIGENGGDNFQDGEKTVIVEIEDTGIWTL